MNYDNYSRALKFAGMPTDLESLLKAHQQQPEEGVIKMMLADELIANNRHHEAQLLQNGGHTFVHNNQIVGAPADVAGLVDTYRHFWPRSPRLRIILAETLSAQGRHVEAQHVREGHEVDHRDDQVVPDYPDYAWPGGIPIVYHAERPDRRRGTGAQNLCGACMVNIANQRAEALAAGEEPDVQSPNLYKAWGHEEGSPIECDDCGREIESAYGDPDEPDEDRE